MTSWKTFQTAACPRMYPEIPIVDCDCDDCCAIRRHRASQQVLNAMGKARLLYCSTCGLSLVTKTVPPTKPCEGCGAIAFSTRQRVQAWADRLTPADRRLLTANRIATS